MISPPPPVAVPVVAKMAPGFLATYNTQDWTFSGESFEGPTVQPIAWTESTLTVPLVTSWSGPGEIADGWVMGYQVGSQAAYTQIGWKQEEGSAPHLFIETDGVVNPDTFAAYPLTPGASYTMAVSCDSGTTIWHDWLEYGGRFHLISSPNTGITCAQAATSVVDETFDPSGVGLAPQGGISGTFVVTGGRSWVEP
jgi:hypothetical protein